MLSGPLVVAGVDTGVVAICEGLCIVVGKFVEVLDTLILDEAE